jgi:hypothetical protein
MSNYKTPLIITLVAIDFEQILHVEHFLIKSLQMYSCALIFSLGDGEELSSPIITMARIWRINNFNNFQTNTKILREREEGKRRNNTLRNYNLKEDI